METKTKLSAATDFFLNDYQRLEGTDTLHPEIRQKAIAAFEQMGIPNRKSEEYKYLPMELLLKGNYSAASAASFSAEQCKQFSLLEEAPLIVLVNGRFVPGLSRLAGLPSGVQVARLTSADVECTQMAAVSSDPFVALNTAFVEDGVCIRVAKACAVALPLQVLYIVSGNESQHIASRILVVADTRAELKLVENFVAQKSSAKAFHNHVTEISIGKEASVQLTKIQEQGDGQLLIDATAVDQSDKSRFTINTFTFSGDLVRNNLNMVLSGEHIESNLNGLYLTKGTQQVDNHTLVDHRFPNCNSNELYKGIVEEKSAATFNGKIFVRKDAQKTNAFQSNKNILLSDEGTVNTKPQLEIYADDVKCSHGTSTGKLDEEKIFYLRSRGLSKSSAKRLLMHAFASEVVNSVGNEGLEAALEQRLSAWFGE